MQNRALVLLGSIALVALVSPPVLAAPYPTDRCVSEKLSALGKQCKAILGAHADLARRGDGERFDAAIAKAQAKLDSAWLRADGRARAKGAECASAGVVGTSSALQASGQDIADEILAGLDLADDAQARCGERLLDDAKTACLALFKAEGRHLKQRVKDRYREKLDAALAKVESKRAARLQKTSAGTCSGLAAPDVGDDLDALVASGLADASTTRSLQIGEWTKIIPPDRVQYRGRTLEPRCSRDTDYFLFARRGTVNKLVMYYMGGGACWNQLTCGLPTHNPDLEGFDLSGEGSGFADFDNPMNPFKDWHVVFVPYCSGDVHWGDQDYNHGTEQSPNIVMHRGLPNAWTAEKWAREHFVHPDRVFVTGSSAGAYGAIMHSLSLQEDVYPSAQFDVLGDAGNGVITDDFLVNEIEKWGVEKNLPDWIPAFDVPITELESADLWVESALFYPENRFATYTTAYDGGSGGQTGFYNVMLNAGDAISALSWWEASCMWNDGMREINLDSAGRAPNFRYYIGTGSRHTVWGNDKVYDDTTGNVPTVVDWINAMLGDTPDWLNVECEDCGVTLPGDPSPPDPNTPPFFGPDNEIICPAP